MSAAVPPSSARPIASVPKTAVRAIDQKLLRLWISALQSQLFNQVLARRIEFLFDDWLWIIDPAFRRIGLW